MDVIPLAVFCRMIYACAAASEMDRIFIVVHCERAGGDDASDAGAAPKASALGDFLPLDSCESVWYAAAIFYKCIDRMHSVWYYKIVTNIQNNP